MKKLLALAFVLILALSLAACGGGNSGNNNTPSNTPSGGNSTNPPASNGSGNNTASGKQIITEDKETGTESTAKLHYFAATHREEFTFDKSGTLTKYVRVYTFEDGADKEAGKANAIANGNTSVSIVGNTLAIEETTYNAIYDIKDVDYDQVKADLDDDGKKYTEK